jgi:mitochondrial splicing suppressor protein 51
MALSPVGMCLFAVCAFCGAYEGSFSSQFGISCGRGGRLCEFASLTVIGRCLNSRRVLTWGCVKSNQRSFTFNSVSTRMKKLIMQSTFTCQRCMTALRSGKQLRLASPRPCVELGRRFTSSWTTRTSQSTKQSTSISSVKASKFQNHRSLSSLDNQKLTKDEPLEYRSPPGLAATETPEYEVRPLLRPNNLFHPFSKSPSPEIRERAAFIKQHAYCPHPAHGRTVVTPDVGAVEGTESKETSTGTLPPAHVDFECPDCGIPVYCSEEHWADDYENHIQIVDTLREINEDDHDLRSGRFHTEFEYPGEQMEEALVNLTNWDTYLYTRNYAAIDSERNMRQATRLLTYPVTLGSVLHELSPYSLRKDGRLTPEGLKSMSGTLLFTFLLESIG